MKIGELYSTRGPNSVKNWASDLAKLDTTELVQTLETTFTAWTGAKLEDLTAVACLLDRFDELLAEAIANNFDEALLTVVLDKTVLLLKNSSNHQLYSSVD
jgi:hypothetical protein